MEKYGDISGCSVDLGCGDGTMSFVMAGGSIYGYDVFMDVGQLQNYNDGADIYNQNPETPLNIDLSKLRYFYEWGVDHKEALVNKSKRFSKFYKNSLVFDLNEKLPFEDSHFDSAFSNVLYWLDDIDKTLLEWQRVLRKTGNLFLFVPNANFKEKAWLYYLAPHSGEKTYLNYFDRGYNQLIHHCYGTSQWEGIFQNDGFNVVHHLLYLTNPIMDIWNVGTRPIAPLLINMANMLSPESRGMAKAEWIDYFAHFFIPIIDGEFERKVPESEAAFHFFVLQKR